MRRCRRARPAKDLAREALSKRTKKIVNKIEKLEKLDAAHRHKLRIAIKKLRYAMEFFDTLFAVRKKERKALSKVLEKLQTAMGKLNDIRVQRGTGKQNSPREGRCKGAPGVAGGGSCARGRTAKCQTASGRSGEGWCPSGQTETVLEIEQIESGSLKPILTEQRAVSLIEIIVPSARILNLLTWFWG